MVRLGFAFLLWNLHEQKGTRHSERSPRSEESLFDPCVLSPIPIPHVAEALRLHLGFPVPVAALQVASWFIVSLGAPHAGFACGSWVAFSRQLLVVVPSHPTR
jgi:hypothetical protein